MSSESLVSQQLGKNSCPPPVTRVDAVKVCIFHLERNSENVRETLEILLEWFRLERNSEEQASQRVLSSYLQCQRSLESTHLAIEDSGYPDFIPIDSFTNLLESEFCESREIFTLSRCFEINPSGEFCDSLLAFL